MADPYIDPFETQLYGKFAREQLLEVLLGRIPALDPLIHFAVASQQEADDAMAAIVAKQHVAKPLDPAAVSREAADVIQRFGRHLDSHKKGTVDIAPFFRGDAPSTLARRRLTKLAGGVRHLLDELIRQQATIREPGYWIGEVTPIAEQLEVLEKQQRAAKVRQIDLGPEVEEARKAWLLIFNANKLLVRGFLAHLGKPELLSAIFDDLAEVHRVGGVSDEAPAEDGAPAADEAKAETEPTPPEG